MKRTINHDKLERDLRRIGHTIPQICLRVDLECQAQRAKEFRHSIMAACAGIVSVALVVGTVSITMKQMNQPLQPGVNTTQGPGLSKPPDTSAWASTPESIAPSDPGIALPESGSSAAPPESRPEQSVSSEPDLEYQNLGSMPVKDTPLGNPLVPLQSTKPEKESYLGRYKYYVDKAVYKVIGDWDGLYYYITKSGEIYRMDPTIIKGESSNTFQKPEKISTSDHIDRDSVIFQDGYLSYVYYVTGENSKSYRVCRIHLDSMKAIHYSFDGQPSNLVIQGEWMYALEDDRLVRLSLQNGSKSTILSQCNDFLLGDNILCAVVTDRARQYLLRCNLDGSNPQYYRHDSGDIRLQLLLRDGELYYSLNDPQNRRGETLYLLKAGDSCARPVVHHEGDFTFHNVIVQGDWVYYIVTEDVKSGIILLDGSSLFKGYLSRIRKDGSGYQEYVEAKLLDRFVVRGDSIYYSIYSELAVMYSEKPIIYSEDWSKSGGIFELSLDGAKHCFISPSPTYEGVWNGCYYNGEMFFLVAPRNPGRLYTIGYNSLYYRYLYKESDVTEQPDDLLD